MTTINRRELLKLATAGTVAVGTGALAVQVLTAGGSQAAPARDTQANAPAGERFAEVYKGRRIEGTAVAAAAPRAARSLAAAPPATAATPDLLIDGVPLHVMVNGDGTYTSVVNHYETFRSLREVARAAVDQLDGAALVNGHHHR
ncbi:secreted protein [Krasilnikovia cinnamomea]|uniref:Secreted protein n=1 Tax=Krasilnikovia cinnamomea TaxID=349313 RepID=A0A4Q7ZEN8_9ACTN|nr:tyrosinase family oxidase copper chaperone [Krasilnikovia cinnamomea]RZU49138.1 secreted protein [Krasilnikovia cinnamomea]